MMSNKRWMRWLSQMVVLSMAIGASMLGLSVAAEADPAYGHPSISYSGVANPPTSDKAQSKLWWNDGSWWADMWTSGSGWHIYRLDRATETWVDTGVRNDTRASTLADVLWDGSHLYIASHVVTESTDSTTVASVSGQPALLYRYSYSGGTYTLDAGFPTTITYNSSESMTIDLDSTGAVWATWTEVTGDTTSGFTSTVYVNNSAPGGTAWATPFVLPVSNPHPSPDDISVIVAFGKKKIGVMWSDQLTGTVWWAWRTDGTNPTASSSWNFQPALQGGKSQAMADDHLNIKQLKADDSGRVFATVKTSLDRTSPDPTLPELVLLVFKPGTGSFTSTTISTAGDCVTRPQIVLDTTHGLVHEFHTGPPTSVTGCAFSGVSGSIYKKTASMDDPVFVPGRGTPVMQQASSGNLNNVTTTKQSVNSTTGIVALAVDHGSTPKRYWFSDEGIAPLEPVSSFTATPTSGTAPLTVSFADTSTGQPTSWSWNFGDGGTSTAQNPAHTYSSAGTYTATLTATNASGSSTATSTITVRPAPPVASFTANPTSGMAPLYVAFADTSSGAPTSWSWDFGDGGTSTAQNPTHPYTTPGTYTVTLTATSGVGSSTATATIAATTLAQAMDAKAAQWSLGSATSAINAIRDGGSYRNYQNGAVIMSPWQSLFVSRGVIRTEWAALGFENGIMGYPTTDEVSGLVNGGVYQNYQGGAIVSSPAGGTHASYGPIRIEWQRLGFEGGVLKYPTSGVVTGLVNGGSYQNYQGGAIVSSPAGGTHGTYGPIRTEWQRLGFEGGVLKYPTSGVVAGLVNGGSYQNYQGGAIVSSPAGGTHGTYGPIRTEWQRLGFEGGILGYPTSRVVTGLINGGSYQNYQGGAIVSSPASGTHGSYGAFRTEWQRLGFEGGVLGYPTSRVVTGLINGGSYQNYQGGAIVSSPAGGTHGTYGRIRTEWQRLGFEQGQLGYPTSGVYAVPNGTAQDFQGGRISVINGTVATTFK